MPDILLFGTGICFLFLTQHTSVGDLSLVCAVSSVPKYCTSVSQVHFVSGGKSKGSFKGKTIKTEKKSVRFG